MRLMQPDQNPTAHASRSNAAIGPSPERLPPLVRFILVNALIGVGAGIVVAAALILSPVTSVGRLLSQSSEPWLAGLLFFSGFMVTFGSLSAGAALMLAGRRTRDED